MWNEQYAQLTGSISLCFERSCCENDIVQFRETCVSYWNENRIHFVIGGVHTTPTLTGPTSVTPVNKTTGMTYSNTAQYFHYLATIRICYYNGGQYHYILPDHCIWLVITLSISDQFEWLFIKWCKWLFMKTSAY